MKNMKTRKVRMGTYSVSQHFRYLNNCFS